jgi:hypothetical protein
MQQARQMSVTVKFTKTHLLILTHGLAAAVGYLIGKW